MTEANMVAITIPRKETIGKTIVMCNGLNSKIYKKNSSIKLNFKSLTCLDFHKYFLKPENKILAQSIGNLNKYL